MSTPAVIPNKLRALLALGNTANLQPEDPTRTATIPLPQTPPQPMVRLAPPTIDSLPPNPTLPNVPDGMTRAVLPPTPADVQESATNARTLGDMNELRRLQTTGSGISQITHPIDPATGLPTTQKPSLLRRFGGALARIGDVAESIVAPGVAALTPGTELHHDYLMRQQAGRVGADLGNEQSLAQTQLLNAEPELKALGAQNQLLRNLAYQQHVNDQAGHYDNQDAAVLALHGLKRDETGKVIPQTYDEMSEPLQAMEDLKQAQTEEAEANAAMKKAQSDPSSPAYRLALARLQTAQVNSRAAVTRAQAYYGRYLQSAYNTGLNGETLPGAPQVEDAAGNVTTVGTGNAAQAVKAQANVAKFNDVHGALDNLEGAAKQLVQSGGTLNSPGVIYALQHKAGTPSEFIQSLDKANLTPAERQYVIAVQAAHENIQALRSAVGSGVSDSQINRLENMLPSGSTPDLNYLLSQTEQIRQTANRLGKGVTTVKGGEGVRGANANNGTPSGKADFVYVPGKGLVKQ